MPFDIRLLAPAAIIGAASPQCIGAQYMSLEQAQSLIFAQAQEFVAALRASGKHFLVLTNNSIFTPRDLRARLAASGIDVPEESLWTSALATAKFLADQRPAIRGEATGMDRRRHRVDDSRRNSGFKQRHAHARPVREGGLD